MTDRASYVFSSRRISAALSVALAACSQGGSGFAAPRDEPAPTEAEAEPVARMPDSGKAKMMDGGVSTRPTVPNSVGTPAAADGSVQEAEPTEPDPPRIAVSELSAETKAWWSYQRAAAYSVVTSSVKVPMRDGVKLACTLSRPGATDRAPAVGRFPGLVVEFTPYVLSPLNGSEAAFFSKRGYNGLVCALRGIGESGDEWQGVFASQDGRDAHDLVEWLATQPFADGRVGMFGMSYGGATSYGAAVEQAPHLLAIAPMEPPHDIYHDINYPGGIETKADGTINNWPPIAQLASFFAIDPIAEYESWHAHPTYDSFWQDRGLRGRHAGIKVPVLTIGGWVDPNFRSGTLANIEAALDRTWAIYGQWAHLPPVDLETCSGGPCAEQPLPAGVLLAWFDHWVMQLEGVPIPPQPTFVSEEGPRAKNDATGPSTEWRDLSAWLPAGADSLSYQLGSDGSLVPVADAPQPLTFHEPGEADEPDAALTFTSTAVAEDRVLLGHPRLALRATLSGSDANLYVQLLDVNEAGDETLVNDGFLKASHRTSHTDPEAVPVGRAIDYQIEIRAQHYRFASGHRVRLRLWGGSKDALIQPSPVDVTVETGGHSTLTLPGFAATP